MDGGTFPEEGILEETLFWWEDHYAVIHASLQFYAPFTRIWAPGGWPAWTASTDSHVFPFLVEFCQWSGGHRAEGEWCQGICFPSSLSLVCFLLPFSLFYTLENRLFTIFFFFFLVVKFFLIYPYWKLPLLSGQEADWRAMTLLLLMLGVRRFGGFCEVGSSRYMDIRDWSSDERFNGVSLSHQWTLYVRCVSHLLRGGSWSHRHDFTDWREGHDPAKKTEKYPENVQEANRVFQGERSDSHYQTLLGNEVKLRTEKRFIAYSDKEVLDGFSRSFGGGIRRVEITRIYWEGLEKWGIGDCEFRQYFGKLEWEEERKRMTAGGEIRWMDDLFF